MTEGGHKVLRDVTIPNNEEYPQNLINTLSNLREIHFMYQKYDNLTMLDLDGYTCSLFYTTNKIGRHHKINR